MRPRDQPGHSDTDRSESPVHAGATSRRSREIAAFSAVRCSELFGIPLKEASPCA